MMPLVRLAVLVVLVGGCIETGRDDDATALVDADVPDVDPVDASDVPAAEVLPPECVRDAECPGTADPCSRAKCDDGTCTIAAIGCNDDNACTSDRCDAALGCVYEPLPPSAFCVTDGGSESCEGDTYHLADHCDGEGHCVDMGREDCGATPGGACYRWTCQITDIGGGCEIASRDDGIACTADGLSSGGLGEFICIDGALHGADVCLAGECVDAGASQCPTSFCQAPACNGNACAARPIGVERALGGNWLMLELFAAGTAAIPRLGTVQAGFAFGEDGVLTTYGSYASVSQAPPGDGDYCVSSDGDLHFALPYGAVASADGQQARKVYRGVVSGSDDFALVYREAEASLGVLIRMPTGNAPKLVGKYRFTGAFRRKVVGVRAALGELVFDERGCTTGGSVRFSDEFEPVAISAGDCQGVFGWLLGTRIAFGDEAYTFRGTSNRGGATAALTLDAGTTTVGDGLVILTREAEVDTSVYDGRHDFARIDIADEVVAAARGDALHDGQAGYLRYEEISLAGQRLVGVGEVQPSSPYPGGHRERSGERLGEDRLRLGQGGSVALGHVGFLVDIRVPGDTSDDTLAFPLGTSLRISVVRP